MNLSNMQNFDLNLSIGDRKIFSVFLNLNFGLILGEANDECSNNPKLSVADSTSIVSSDSNILPFNIMVGRSGASNTSFSTELSDQLDNNEALLRSRLAAFPSAEIFGCFCIF